MAPMNTPFATAAAGARDGPHGYLAVAQPRQDFRAGPHDGKAVQIQEIHEGRRIGAAQRAVEGERRQRERQAETLR